MLVNVHLMNGVDVHVLVQHLGQVLVRLVGLIWVVEGRLSTLTVVRLILQSVSLTIFVEV